MRVYRMENDKHVGPFNADVPGIPRELAMIGALIGHPLPMMIELIVQDAEDHKEITEEQIKEIIKLAAPEKDGIPDLKQTEVCAATSLEQLREWFPPALDRSLREHGQSIHCYEVADKAVRTGEHQCVVRRSALKGHEVALETADK